MKPVSYQGTPSAINSGHPALDHLLNTSKVMRCEKCGFMCTSTAVYNKHMMEHLGTRICCFYCNKVSFSEAESRAHFKQHTRQLGNNYPFTCPHCGQGYMRRLCLVKHIERLHRNGPAYVPGKAGTTKIPQVPVSSALPSLPTADPSSLRPVVRVTVPTPSLPAFKLGKDERRVKTLDTNVSHVAKGNAELLPPLNGLMQQHRNLTVSLPEEVTIPAGCLVELVEVKTVNGTKELKLRLVSKQESESVIKDTRTMVSQNVVMGKQLSSVSNHPNTEKSVSLGMSTVNRKLYETKTVNVDRPAVNISPTLLSPNSKDKCGLKRKSQEIINLECNKVMPNKVPRTILNPVREGNSGIKVAQREPVNHSAAPPILTLTRTNRLTGGLHPENMGACVSQRVVDDRKNSHSEHSKVMPPRRSSDIKTSPPDVPLAVKLEPGEKHLRSSPASLTAPLPAAAQLRPPAVPVFKNNIPSQAIPVSRTLNATSSYNTTVISNCANSKSLAWKQEVRSCERVGEGDMPEPEGFPVISSVFSLSQQPEDVQGPIQPLVMALRGIVMDKSLASAGQEHGKMTNGKELVTEVPKLACRSQKVSEDDSPTSDLSLSKPTCEKTKVVEHQSVLQHPPSQTCSDTRIKEEKESTSTSTDNEKCRPAADTKSSTCEESPATLPSRDDAPDTPTSPQQTTKNEHDISSKFLTVSLKRVQVGVWKQNKKGLKLRISKYKTQVPMGSLNDYTAIYPMPLKVDQLVKRPGPNQPVVVLNHPRPRPSVHRARVDTVAAIGATAVVPKCQILKMRLSKVMGQKYEVMGCTVGVFPNDQTKQQRTEV
ncbi:uncharacterized protein V6R79_018751 [Siganus canaliculatus]